MGSQRKISTEHLRRFTCFSLGADSTKKQHQNASPNLDRGGLNLSFQGESTNSSKTDPRPHRIHGTWYMYRSMNFVDFLWLIFFMLGKYLSGSFFLGGETHSAGTEPRSHVPGCKSFETHRHQGNDPWVFIITPRRPGISMINRHPGKLQGHAESCFAKGFFFKGKSCKWMCFEGVDFLSFLLFVCVFIPKMTYT